MTGDDLLEGDVPEDRRLQAQEELEHERWKRWFSKKLTWGVAILALVLVAALFCYVFNYEHKLADIPAIIALSAIPTVLIIGLMRYYLPKDPISNEEDVTPPQMEMARQIVQMARELSGRQ